MSGLRLTSFITIRAYPETGSGVQYPALTICFNFFQTKEISAAITAQKHFGKENLPISAFEGPAGIIFPCFQNNNVPGPLLIPASLAIYLASSLQKAPCCVNGISWQPVISLPSRTPILLFHSPLKINTFG
jgi:hypothetical protein